MRQRGPLIAVAAGVLAVVVMLVFLITPRLSKINTTQADLTEAQQEQVTLEAQLAQLKGTEAQAKEIRTQLALLDAAVPGSANLPDLIRMLNDVADQSAVDFLSLAPGSPTAVPGGEGSTGGTAPPIGEVGVGTLPEGISVIPMSITVDGSYFAIAEYLFRLETLPRISKVSTLGLSVGSAGYPSLSVTLTVSFYTTDVDSGPGSQTGAQSTSSGSTEPTPIPSGTTPTPTATPSV
jgi:Tfp pilus assembly protein PilO